MFDWWVNWYFLIPILPCVLLMIRIIVTAKPEKTCLMCQKVLEQPYRKVSLRLAEFGPMEQIYVCEECCNTKQHLMHNT